MFASIQDFKDRAEFFPAGKIIPQRILKGPRKIKCCFLFGSDSWALPTPHGYVVACNAEKGGSAIRIRRTKAKTFRHFWGGRNQHQVNLHGSPYRHFKEKGNGTLWLGNCGTTEDEWLESLNYAVSLRTSGSMQIAREAA